MSQADSRKVSNNDCMHDLVSASHDSRCSKLMWCLSCLVEALLLSLAYGGRWVFRHGFHCTFVSVSAKLYVCIDYAHLTTYMGLGIVQSTHVMYWNVLVLGG